MEEESLEVEGEGSAALSSAADLDKICGCEDGGSWDSIQAECGGEKDGAPMFSGGVGRLWLRLIVGMSVAMEPEEAVFGMARELG